MICRYFDVVFMLCFVMISANAQGNSSTFGITASPVISVNSSEIATTPISSPVVIKTSIVSSTRTANTSSTSPVPASTSHVTPSSSPTPMPTKAPSPHATPSKGRSFDAASFFGGIILGIIVTIACFVGYTWWQNKRKSYHSL